MMQCFSDLQQPVNNGAKVQIYIGEEKPGKLGHTTKSILRYRSYGTYFFHSFGQGAYALLL